MRYLYYGILILTVLNLKADFLPRPELPKLATCVFEPHQITIDAHPFNEKECKAYFGKNLIKEGYRPLVITITNLSDDLYRFRKGDIEIMTACPEDIFDLYHTGQWGNLFAVSRFLTMGQVPLSAIADQVSCLIYNYCILRKFLYYTMLENKDYLVMPQEKLTLFLFAVEKHFTHEFNVFYYNLSTKTYEAVWLDLLPSYDTKKLFLPSIFMVN